MRYLPLCLCFVIACSSSPTEQVDATPDLIDSPEDMQAPPEDLAKEAVELRVATFNASMYRDQSGGLISALESGDNAQILAAVEVIQTLRPDVVLINEFDWDTEGRAATILREQVLTKPATAGLEGIDYGHVYVPGTNTGLSSGVDLNNDGKVTTEPGSRDYGNDSLGYGTFHGQYGMVILSKYPILAQDSRTFQEFLWRDMPGNLLPTQWYSEESAALFRLSSKNHADVVIDVQGHRLHVLASHPTPPGFDGDEDRNGKRNHDEIKFWTDYIDGADYMTDDAGIKGGLGADESFVVMGDLNSDPKDGGSLSDAITGLLTHERVQDTQPKSAGAVSASAADGQVNTTHEGDAALDTADFSDRFVGNVRVDYVLPSSNVTVRGSSVVWPESSEELSEVAARASDHHMVWVDITLGE